MRHPRVALLAVVVWLASCASNPPRVPPAPPPPPPVVLNPQGITFAAVGDVMLGTDYPDNTLPDDDGVSFLASVTPVLTRADVAFGNLEGVLMDGGEAVKRCRPARAATKNAPASAAPAARTTTAAPPPPPTPPPTPTGPATAPAAGGDTLAPSTEDSDDDAPGGAATATTNADAQSNASPASPASPATTGQTLQPGAGPPTAITPPGAATAPSPQPPATADTSSNPAPTGGACFVFRSPTRYATYLRDAGFRVMSLANNHAQDFGDVGRASSMQALDAVGIRHSGRDGDIAEWTTRGRRFALVAFAPNVGSHQLNDLARAREIVTSLSASHDIVIVSFHGGAEGDGASKLPFAHELYAGEDRGDVVEFAHAVVDAGADLVLGSGPHVMRAVELYRDRLIAYSLGNFATYYGISVNGIRGTSGVLTARVADDGKFIDARFTPTVQIRPGGPQPDPQRRALLQLRNLTLEAFPTGSLAVREDGLIQRTP
jgi:poly-gamma-glutamate capsule biosynthesis protein CapA/YwtB (metallophosphatase superfamily)